MIFCAPACNIPQAGASYMYKHKIMGRETAREQRFTQIISDHHDLLAKVCYLYSGPDTPFDDLYQEVLANIWEGMDSFRGDAKLSTWLYRAAINTCITWYRRNSRHSANRISLEQMVAEPAAPPESSAFVGQLRALHAMISRLLPLEKAIITMWLDEKPYDEIAAVTGLSRNNVAVKVHRIKDKLSKMANE